ncbi:MAG TPA: chitobiase/beta-hexosaminidase C-terminal domain-containing protein [Spirochaetia bacterium]|nr:chitobiase/beta-hexosaminidase C-terminal domain-containing protein [Spirochaetia bacterium]
MGKEMKVIVFALCVCIGLFSCTAPLEEQLVPPQISVPEGTYDEPISVTLHHPDPYAWLYYTVDGSDPVAEGSPYYGGGILLQDACTLSACAAKGDMYSPVVSAHYRFSFRVAWMGRKPEDLQSVQNAGSVSSGCGLFLRQNFGDYLGEDVYASRFEFPEGGDVVYELAEPEDGSYSILDEDGNLIGEITSESSFSETLLPGDIRYLMALQGSEYYYGPRAFFEVRIYLTS